MRETRTPPSSRKFNRTAAAVAIALAGILAFTGISANKFWDDEANTAIFARNLLATGHLSAWDGTNLIGYRDGAELNEELENVFMPPLQYWVAAGAMSVFGSREAALRGPFVVIGLLAMIALALFARDLLTDEFPWYLPLLILALAPAYLLYIRNCRYYSPGVALTICLYACASGRISGRLSLGIRGLTALVCGAALMFTNYFNAVGALATVPMILLLRDHRSWKTVGVIAAAWLGAALVGVHVILNANPFDAPVPRPDDLEGLPRFFTLLWMNFRDLANFEFFGLLLLPVLAMPFLWRRLRPARKAAGVGLLVTGMMILTIVITCVFSLQSASKSSVADMRYLVPLIPLGAIVAAIALHILWEVARPLGGVALATLVFTNILQLGFIGVDNSYLPPRGLECTLCQYVGEVVGDRVTTTEQIVDYISTLGEDDVVMVVPPFMGYSPMYYLPHRKFCCQLLEKHPLSENLASTIPDYIFWERAEADWGLINAMEPAVSQGPLRIRGIEMGYFAYKETLDVPARDCSRPEIPWHSFDGKNVRETKHHKFFVVKIIQ